MRKVYAFSLLLVAGLLLSQTVPHLLGENFSHFKTLLDAALYISLAYIMINVGREFEINKKEWRSYTKDYFVAMGCAALPWVFVALYYLYMVAPPEMELTSSTSAWKETFLLSRYAAPTSAGILFTMLIAAGLKSTWVFKKVQVLAIFDDLDTILLMIPLQIMLIGMKWQMFVILIVAILLIVFGWQKMNSYNFDQGWRAILRYSILMYATIEVIYRLSNYLFGVDGSIHIEILLPAFILGVVMRNSEQESETDEATTKQTERVGSYISYLFMLLVGMSMPLFLGIDFQAMAASSTSIISTIPMPPRSVIALHVFLITLISNLGKMLPLLLYRDRKIGERLAVSIGMFTRGEVGAGVLFIAIGYQLGGTLLVISVLAMSLNLLLTGIFISFAKKLTINASKDDTDQSSQIEPRATTPLAKAA